VTKEEILAMEAGPELDSLVAEYVMNRKCTCEGSYWGKCDRHWNGGIDLNYSADIAFAWHVVEQLQELEYWLRIIAGRNGKWEVSATVEVGKLPDTNGNPSRMIAKINGYIVPESICKMALVAVLGL